MKPSEWLEQVIQRSQLLSNRSAALLVAHALVFMMEHDEPFTMARLREHCGYPDPAYKRGIKALRRAGALSLWEKDGKLRVTLRELVAEQVLPVGEPADACPSVQRWLKIFAAVAEKSGWSPDREYLRRLGSQLFELAKDPKMTDELMCQVVEEHAKERKPPSRVRDTAIRVRLAWLDKQEQVRLTRLPTEVEDAPMLEEWWRRFDEKCEAAGWRPENPEPLRKCLNDELKGGDLPPQLLEQVFDQIVEKRLPGWLAAEMFSQTVFQYILESRKEEAG